MPKVIRSEVFDRIAEIVGRFPDGAELDGILAAMGEGLSRRTLQRRLADLVTRGRITGRREQKSFKYRLAPITGTLEVTLPGVQVEVRGEVYVPTSPDGAEIKTYVRQPVQGRRPVGYNIEFLDAYRPNETWYLPDKLRGQLHTLGRSPADHAPAGTFARNILNRLLIDLSWASSRLEGNTYNRLDTERLIQFGEAAAGKDAIETQMILNHKTAIEYLVHDADRVAVDAETIIAVHALLSDGLLADPMACGKLRNRAVEIAGSVYLPMALPQRIEESFEIVLGMAAEIEDPFEQAFFLMVHLPYLQPFEDVNKSVSRLVANIPLIKGNLSPLSFIDVPERANVDALLGVYELNRIELLRDVFVWAYERSCQQYVAVKSQLVPPDAFSLRYRAALAEAVRAIIRGGQSATRSASDSGHWNSMPGCREPGWLAEDLCRYAGPRSRSAGGRSGVGCKPDGHRPFIALSAARVIISSQLGTSSSSASTSRLRVALRSLGAEARINSTTAWQASSAGKSGAHPNGPSEPAPFTLWRPSTMPQQIASAASCRPSQALPSGSGWLA